MKNSWKHFEPYKLKRLFTICFMIIGMFPNIFSQDYFQQKVNYSIQVTLHDKLHELTAFERIEYTNNSVDTLQFLYFHVWPNAYSGNQTDLAKQLFALRGKERLFDNPELRGSIDSIDFIIDSRKVQWNLLPNQPDICKIILNRPLLPGKTILITTPFHVKIPKGVTSRLGHIGESYQISQWYPKPAVYDRNGWHQMPYLDQGEFYSEFGKFDVSITLPENYIVGASGNLQTKEEMEKMNKLAADTTWKKLSNYGTTAFPKSSDQLKTIRFTGNNMHDFAWFADKRFHVMKGKVILPKTGKGVATWLLFTNQQSKQWKKAIPYMNNAITDFSKWVGDYPYSTFTAVQSALTAGDGMEYPGIAVIGLAKDDFTLDKVIGHEIGHNWFYGALGSDERRYPFMDEGITTAYEVRYLAKKYPEKKLWTPYFQNLKQAKFFHVDKMPEQRIMEFEWLIQARTNLEQPMNLSSTDFNEQNYYLMLYNKAAISFNYLRAYLGDSLFDLTMQDYYQKWKFKHPQPEDLRAVFESQTGKNLSWFFDDLLGTNKRLDYKMEKFENGKLLVKNAGELASPLVIAGMKGDSVCFEKWMDGFEGQKWIDVPKGDFTELKIDPKHQMPELYRLNNNIRTTGIFPKADPIQPQLLFSIENPEKRHLMYIPVANWNHENGFMVGMAVHNGFIIPKQLEYFAMPFYTFSSSTLVGYGRIAYNIMPYNNIIKRATVSLEGTQFGAPGNQNYLRLKAGLDINFRTNKETNPIRQKIYGRYLLASDLYQIENFVPATMNSYLQLGYNLQKNTLVNPYNLSVSFESGKAFQKAAVEFNYKYSYTGQGNGLEMRFFGGTMLNNSETNSFYALSPNGRSGRDQYLYEGIYPDRFNIFPTTLFSRQMTISEGGLVSNVTEKLGYSKWLISLSFTSSLPWGAEKTGIKPFVNLLINDHGLGGRYNSIFFGEAGLKASLLSLFEIYIPFLVTNNIQSINSGVKDRIRIVLNLDFSKEMKSGTAIGN